MLSPEPSKTYCCLVRVPEICEAPIAEAQLLKSWPKSSAMFLKLAP